MERGARKHHQSPVIGLADRALVPAFILNVEKYILTEYQMFLSPEEHGGGARLAVLVSLVEARAFRGLALKLRSRAPPPGVARELELADVSAPGIMLLLREEIMVLSTHLY